jgi:hypothetical protein
MRDHAPDKPETTWQPLGQLAAALRAKAEAARAAARKPTDTEPEPTS